MKKLNYYGFYFLPYEHNKGREYEELNTGKLYSEYSTDPDNPQNIEKILYSPPGSEGYSANMKLPATEINFYNFSVWDIALQLDDFMRTPEINSYLGLFVSPKIKRILTEYNLPDYRYYSVNVYFQKKVHQYFFLLMSRQNNPINYQKSIFVDAYEETKKVAVKQYKDLLELRTFEEDNSKYWAGRDIEEQKIVFEQEIDIYAPVTLRLTPFYFSERLKERLVKEKITGIKIHQEEDDDVKFYLNK